MRTTNININLDPAKEGKWYAKENVTKRGETTVTFFQRDGKRSFLQKFKDFRNNVHSGTELASKYSKELGLPAEALSNPKNKSEKVTISNDKLNTLFRHTYQKIRDRKTFEQSDPLVSYFNEKQNVDICINNYFVLKGTPEPPVKFIPISPAASDDVFQFTWVKLSNHFVNNYGDEKLTNFVVLSHKIKEEPNFSATKEELLAARDFFEGVVKLNVTNFNKEKIAVYKLAMDASARLLIPITQALENKNE